MPANQAGMAGSGITLGMAVLGEHQRTGTRLLHVIGTGLFITQAGAAAALRKPPLLLSGIITAYAMAWVGHFFVEHNRPATFKYPFQSLVGDFKMFFNILTGREPLVVSLGPANSVKDA